MESRNGYNELDEMTGNVLKKCSVSPQRKMLIIDAN